MIVTAPLVASYRLQLHKDFTLRDVVDRLTYFKKLGVSHLYLSPLLESAPGSNHGYDVMDFSRLSDERGGEEALAMLNRILRDDEAGLRLILDIVPNHMGLNGPNPYWYDVLAKGKESPHWTLFDMRTDGVVHLPYLTQPLEQSCREGSVTLADDPVFGRGIRVDGRYLPLSAGTQEIIDRNGGDVPPDRLAALLEQQAYKLVESKDMHAIDYRRFFHIMDLIGVRVEDHRVYARTHDTLLRVLKDHPSIEGLRVDHVDGLVAPKAYLDRLHDAVPHVWVEKILSRDEILPDDWRIAGTTGYEFIDRAGHLLVHPGGFAALEQDWQENVDARWNDFESASIDARLEALNEFFASECERLVDLSVHDDTERDKARLFWTALSVTLPVYRTYAHEGPFNEADMAHVAHGLQTARARFGHEFEQAEVLFLSSLLNPSTDRAQQARSEWQQLSGAVMAKGLEDRAHYRYTPLAALNEVGVHPVPASPAVDAYADWVNERAAKWPHAMNGSSSHDTKRAEDVRHRLYALADMPDEWRTFREQASALVASLTAPLAPADRDFYYQTLLGTWPVGGAADEGYRTRLHVYMEKALREASSRTDWVVPAAEYEKAVHTLIDGTLDHPGFTALVRALDARIAPAGALNSLTVQTLKILSPAMPDIYQGTENWDLSLVDPDNRRPVDYDRLNHLLDRADEDDHRAGRAALLQSLQDDWRHGAIKPWLTRLLLQVRRDHLLTPGQALHLDPLRVAGPRAENVIAYTLGQGRDTAPAVAVITPRYPGRLLTAPFNRLGLAEADWQDTAVALPPAAPGRWQNVLTGENLPEAEAPVPLVALMRPFPVAVLTAVPA